jgi:hypothetical protein
VIVRVPQGIGLRGQHGEVIAPIEIKVAPTLNLATCELVGSRQ